MRFAFGAVACVAVLAVGCRAARETEPSVNAPDAAGSSAPVPSQTLADPRMPPSSAAGAPTHWRGIDAGPRGDAAIGSASVVGGRIPNADRVVAGMRAGFRACYNRGLATNPDIEGSMRCTARVGTSGDVVSALCAGSLPADVTACVERRIRSATFAPPEGGMAAIVIPVTFKRQ